MRQLPDRGEHDYRGGIGSGEPPAGPESKHGLTLGGTPRSALPEI